MGEFTKRVQSGQVSGPLRRNFTDHGWKREFAAADSPDDTDRHVYNAALAFYSKLETIRSRLKISSSPSLSATTKLRAFVAASNHNFIVAHTKTRYAIEKAGAEWRKQAPAGFRLEELMATVKIELPGGFQWSPNEIVESLVDGIEVPVRFALREMPDLLGTPRPDQVVWNDIALEINLGITFRHVEDIWDDCLWNNYGVVGDGRIKAFVPQNVDSALAHILGKARRTSLAAGYSIMAIKYHRGIVARGYLPHLREVRAISRQGRRQVIKVSKPGEQTQAQEELFVIRSYANEPYYAGLLEEPLPQLGGLTLSLILDAWVVISRAALVLMQSIGENEVRQVKPDSPIHTWLPPYAPVLQLDALAQALSTAAGIKPVDGRRLIEFFTFRGQAGQEIWDSPLVPVGIKTVAPVFAAVVSPNLRRLVDVWMRQAGVDLGKRGPAFESHVRASAQESISSSKVLRRDAICIADDYTFKPTGSRSEQIDLLLVIGSTVLLAEAKCILEPTDAKGVAMHRKTVVGAAEQVLRKSQALKDSREEFVADVKRFGINLPLDFQVLPLVVVSTSAHVGIPACGVPVIDEYILERFLVGELEDVAVTGSDLEIQKTIKTIFYTDLADAQVKAQQYFSSPPQIQRLRDGITSRVVPLYAIDEQDWEGFVATFEYVPSQSSAPTQADDSASIFPV